MKTKPIRRRTWLMRLAPGAAGVVAATSSAADEPENPDVTMTVKGLACPFCAQGVEKKIRRLPNVRRIATELESGEVRLRLKPKRIDLKRLREAVEKAGFTPGEIDVADDVEVTAD